MLVTRTYALEFQALPLSQRNSSKYFNAVLIASNDNSTICKWFITRILIDYCLHMMSFDLDCCCDPGDKSQGKIQLLRLTAK